ncbi:MAG: hypothetical protein RLZZ379_1192 [Pseudomonadota bacterium]
MQNSFKSIAIIGKYMNPAALQLMRADLVTLAQHLQSKNIKVCIESQTAKHAQLSEFSVVSLDDIGHKADMAIVTGALAF